MNQTSNSSEGNQTDLAQKEAESNEPFSIKEILSKYGNDFTQEEFNKIFTRKDGFNHILLSDVEKITKSLENDFKDVIKVSSIGQTTQGRDIKMITLDATGSMGGPSSS